MVRLRVVDGVRVAADGVDVSVVVGVGGGVAVGNRDPECVSECVNVFEAEGVTERVCEPDDVADTELLKDMESVVEGESLTVALTVVVKVGVTESEDESVAVGVSVLDGSALAEDVTGGELKDIDTLNEVEGVALAIGESECETVVLLHVGEKEGDGDTEADRLNDMVSIAEQVNVPETDNDRVRECDGVALLVGDSECDEVLECVAVGDTVRVRDEEDVSEGEAVSDDDPDVFGDVREAVVVLDRVKVRVGHGVWQRQPERAVWPSLTSTQEHMDCLRYK